MRIFVTLAAMALIEGACIWSIWGTDNDIAGKIVSVFIGTAVLLAICLVACARREVSNE